MNIEKIREMAAQCLPEQTDLLMRFCAVDSESKHVPGNRQVIDMARAVLTEIPGIEMKEIFYEGTGAHLIARIRPEHPKGKILISAHLYTVFPVGYAAQYPPYIDDEQWLHGLGSGDCKAGFAVSAYAVKIAAELGLLPEKEIVMLYTCDEEIGSPTASVVFKREAEGAECAFVFESAIETENGYGIVTQRDGVVLGALDIKGVEAHAGGAYLQGHSAVKELAHKILKYYAFNDYEREIFYNVAPIRGGRPNGIVAGDAHMEFCVAGIPTNDTFPEVEANIESLAASNEDPVCETTVEHHILFPALERDVRSAKLFDLAKRAGGKIGMTLEETSDPTATDACWLCYYGVPAIDALGPVQSGMHTTEEKLLLTTVPDKTALFAVMLGMMQEEEA
ncbi:MAG: M20/M25/M40 family metallo-hydrolase [Eubacterium sp.]|nr:M20/M25/M40 family metallo-hydrolase [Eubacterium sp.]